MPRLLYSFLFYLAVPLILLRLLGRSIKAPAYRRRWGERFALASAPAGLDDTRPLIWIHAVSVGETVAAAPLVDALLQGDDNPQVLITTMTPTGSDRVKALFSDRVLHCYLPYDLPGAMKRFVDRVKPSLLILMETELWPNLVYHVGKSNALQVLANARLSEKSAAGYRRFAGMTGKMLQTFDAIGAQSEEDAQRLIGLDANPKSVQVTGSLKFNVAIDRVSVDHEPALAELKASGRTVIILASTRDNEEAKLLPAINSCLNVVSDLLFLVVPRHPERFDQVAKLFQGQDYHLQRRSALKASGDARVAKETQILLGDSMGEMALYYSLADIAFVGGSLVDTGCQNVLEPAALGIPVVAGPSQYNFAGICRQLEEAGALHTVADANALADCLLHLVRDKATAEAMGRAGRELVQANQQALPRLLDLIAGLSD